MINVSNFTSCDIEDIEDVDAEDTADLERRLFNECDGDEQKFINIMTLLSAYYGNVSSDLISKWSR